MFLDCVVGVVLVFLLSVLVWIGIVLYYKATNQCSFGELFYSRPPENIIWRERIVHEIENFEADRNQPGPNGAGVNYEQFGVAENTTNEEEDKDDEDPGDLWLCDNRAFIFMALHLSLSLSVSLGVISVVHAASTIEHLGFVVHLSIAVLSVAIMALWICYASYRFVFENERGAVKRFGRQLNGYLRPGLQFVVPLIEYFEPISLKKMIWGPYPEGETDVQYIGGIAGTINPSPGIFKILLARRWSVLVEVAVTMHVARNKNAWYTFLNSYSSTDELGQQIAVVISAIITRAVGEGTGTNNPATPVTPAGAGTGANQTTPATPAVAVSPEAVMDKFNDLANAVPEICSNLLKGLLEIRRRLPVVIESIALTGPIADEELKQWLQVQDESGIEVLRQKRIGEASKERFLQLRDYLHELDPELDGPALLAAFQQLNAQEVQRLFAEAGKGAGSLDTLLRAFLAGKVNEITKPDNSGQGKGQKPNP